MAKLLCEFSSLEIKPNLVERIKEAREKRTSLVFPAILQRAEAKNQNNRRYPRHILEREVENYKKAIEEGRAGGELNHPDSSVVDLERISHKIRKIWWEGDEVMGEVEIHPSLPKAEVALGLMEAGMKVGISSRGVGEVQKGQDGSDIVDESFMLISFDLVSEPSTHNAWLREGKEVNFNEIYKNISKNDRVNRIVNEILKGRI